MSVYFIASSRLITEDIHYFRRIIKTAYASGYDLAVEWVESAYESATGAAADTGSLNWVTVYKQNMDALSKADLVIVEASTRSFAVGYQTAVALQQKKPTLLLSRKRRKERAFDTGVIEDFLTYKNYDEENLESIVEAFLKENRIDPKNLRFNFFIDRQIYNYLRWAAAKKHKTKAEILRELVLKEINKQDL